MKKIISLIIVTTIILFSCSKDDPVPTLIQDDNAPMGLWSIEKDYYGSKFQGYMTEQLLRGVEYAGAICDNTWDSPYNSCEYFWSVEVFTYFGEKNGTKYTSETSNIVVSTGNHLDDAAELIANRGYAIVIFETLDSNTSIELDGKIVRVIKSVK